MKTKCYGLVAVVVDEAGCGAAEEEKRRLSSRLLACLLACVTRPRTLVGHVGRIKNLG